MQSMVELNIKLANAVQKLSERIEQIETTKIQSKKTYNKKMSDAEKLALKFLDQRLHKGYLTQEDYNKDVETIEEIKKDDKITGVRFRYKEVPVGDSFVLKGIWMPVSKVQLKKRTKMFKKYFTWNNK